MTHQEIIERLQTGNNRYTQDNNQHALQNQVRRDELTKGQKPWAVILSCADSRVVPELIFDTGIGELFVLRVAGNVSNVSTVASIEYAVANLETSLILVLGHESCGAVGAALTGKNYGDNLTHLLANIEPAIKASPSPQVNDVVKTHAKLSEKMLPLSSTILADKVKTGTLKIISGFYHLQTGKVSLL